eukprot:6178709-Pleurochrysis_carterae.AAC.7
MHLTGKGGAPLSCALQQLLESSGQSLVSFSWSFWLKAHPNKGGVLPYPRGSFGSTCTALAGLGGAAQAVPRSRGTRRQYASMPGTKQLRRPSVFRSFDRSPLWTLQMYAVENANAAQHSDI